MAITYAREDFIRLDPAGSEYLLYGRVGHLSIPWDESADTAMASPNRIRIEARDDLPLSGCLAVRGDKTALSGGHMDIDLGPHSAGLDVEFHLGFSAARAVSIRYRP